MRERNEAMRMMGLEAQEESPGTALERTFLDKVSGKYDPKKNHYPSSADCIDNDRVRMGYPKEGKPNEYGYPRDFAKNHGMYMSNAFIKNVLDVPKEKWRKSLNASPEGDKYDDYYLHHSPYDDALYKRQLELYKDPKRRYEMTKKYPNPKTNRHGEALFGEGYNKMTDDDKRAYLDELGLDGDVGDVDWDWLDPRFKPMTEDEMNEYEYMNKWGL